MTFIIPTAPIDPIVFTVQELNSQIKNYLEHHFSQIFVTGEISNFSHPSSGHMYFTLKDSKAQIRCAFFKQRQWGLKLRPFDGMQVLVRGKLSLYSERGDYQLIIDQLSLQGEGALQQKYEILKNKLAAQGYFDESRKRPIPKNIKTLGIITSATGAALQDILSVIQRRWPLLFIIIYDSQVQGEEAPNQLIRAIQKANLDKHCECLLLTRGGGSLEDLWAFNDEKLCHEIFKSTLPIISAVGHEIDFSLSDFVADLRAATPSAAAELVTPDRENLIKQIQMKINHSERLVLNKISRERQRVMYLKQSLAQAMFKQIQINKIQYQKLWSQLKYLEPRNLIQENKTTHQRLNLALYKSMDQTIFNRKLKLGNLIRQLEILGPLSILKRGFSIAQNLNDEIITEINQVKIHQKIKIKLSSGQMLCEVLSKTGG